MDAVRDHDHLPGLPIVQPRQDDGVEQFDRAFELLRTARILDVVRIVNDDEVGAAAGDAAAKRDSIESAAGGGRKIHHCGMIFGDPCLEDLFEPFGLQNAADIASNGFCELFGIGHDHDLR